jgi:hypothetical protein
MWRGLILAAVALASWSAHAADAPGTITILEGQALIYRGLGRLHADEGVRLALGDIVETSAETFLQIEFDNKSVAQVGPSTRLMLNGSSGRQKPARWLYMMNGWAKFSGPPAADAGSAPGFDLRAPLFELPAHGGVVVVQASAAEATLFVERGELRLVEPQGGPKPLTITLGQGDYYKRKAGARGTVNPGAMQGFLNDMPRIFRDSLPQRAERFRDAEVEAKTAPDFVYADVEMWLKAEPAIRKPLMQRWRAKAKDSAFRAALVANLSAHFEWDPILFPEKYLPKPAASQPASSGALQPLQPNPR